MPSLQEMEALNASKTKEELQELDGPGTGYTFDRSKGCLVVASGWKSEEDGSITRIDNNTYETDYGKHAIVGEDGLKVADADKGLPSSMTE